MEIAAPGTYEEHNLAKDGLGLRTDTPINHHVLPPLKDALNQIDGGVHSLEQLKLIADRMLFGAALSDLVEKFDAGDDTWKSQHEATLQALEELPDDYFDANEVLDQEVGDDAYSQLGEEADDMSEPYIHRVKSPTEPRGNFFKAVERLNTAQANIIATKQRLEEIAQLLASPTTAPRLKATLPKKQVKYTRALALALDTVQHAARRLLIMESQGLGTAPDLANELMGRNVRRGVRPTHTDAPASQRSHAAWLTDLEKADQSSETALREWLASAPRREKEAALKAAIEADQLAALAYEEARIARITAAEQDESDVDPATESNGFVLDVRDLSRRKLHRGFDEGGYDDNHGPHVPSKRERRQPAHMRPPFSFADMPPADTSVFVHFSTTDGPENK